MGKTIIHFSLKGGVGKTKMNFNAGAYWAMEGKKVLMVDMELQRDLTKNLGFDPDAALYEKDYLDITNLFGFTYPGIRGMEEINLYEAKYLIRKTPHYNMFAIPGSSKLDYYWEADEGYSGAYGALREYLDSVKDVFDYIIIDAGPRTNDVALAAVAAADYVVLPCHVESYSVDAITNFYELVYDKVKITNPSLKVLGVVANNYDNSLLSDYNGILSQTCDVHGLYLFKTKIRRSNGIMKSNSYDMMQRAKMDRGLCAFDPYIAKNYPNATADYVSYMNELLVRMAQAENGGI